MGALCLVLDHTPCGPSSDGHQPHLASFTFLLRPAFFSEVQHHPYIILTIFYSYREQPNTAKSFFLNHNFEDYCHHTPEVFPRVSLSLPLVPLGSVASFHHPPAPHLVPDPQASQSPWIILLPTCCPHSRLQTYLLYPHSSFHPGFKGSILPAQGRPPPLFCKCHRCISYLFGAYIFNLCLIIGFFPHNTLKKMDLSKVSRTQKAPLSLHCPYTAPISPSL